VAISREEKPKPPEKPAEKPGSLLDAPPTPARTTGTAGAAAADILAKIDAITRTKRGEAQSDPTAKKTSEFSALSAASAVSNASPLGAGAASELAPAAAVPALATGVQRPKDKATKVEMAAAAASILGGATGDDAANAAAMRESLEESAALARASASARARVAALRARGASLPELDGRLAAADLLNKRGEPDAALKILEEVLVLSNALVAAYGVDGPIDIPDPLDVRIDKRLEKVFEKAGEAARARTDELLASARLAEKVEEIARGRLEELLTSKRLAAKIEEVAQRHAEAVASGAVEALLSSDAFTRAVDARARARAEEAFASVKAGASPEAIEAAAEKVLARRESQSGVRTKDPMLDPGFLEQQMVPLVSSLVKQVLSDEQAVANKIRSIVNEEVSKVSPGNADRDEIQLRQLVDAEIARYENVAQPSEKMIAEQAAAVARSEVMQQTLEEQFNVLRAALKKDVIEELERIAAANKKKAMGK